MKNITTYDNTIKTAVEKHLPPNYDWKLLKSQFMAESALNCNAESPVGACGIAQFMPETWKETRTRMKKSLSDPKNALDAIETGAFYMNSLLTQWSPATRTSEDRRKLAMASYNAGLGNVIKAQKRASNVADFDGIIAHLHLVTGEKNADETKNYVKNIYKFYKELSQA